MEGGTVSMEHRIERLERVTAAGEDPPVVIVDRPGEGPADPIERAAWLQSRVPKGAQNVMFIRVIREARPMGRLEQEDEDDD